MKKHLFLFILMLLPILASAQTVSDVQNSGCISEKRADVTTIVLTKEGSTLSVQLLNYEENCCTEDFNATYSISGGSDSELCSVSINVAPTIEYDCDCICPFNLSFTVRDLVPNIFNFDCLWHKGQVELTEGETLVLEYNNPDPKESLYGEWWLVGWNDGGNWFEVDNNYVRHHNLSIEIPREGYVKAYSMVNEIFVGLLTLNGNEIILGGEKRGMATEVYYDIMENLFFEDHICDIKSYQLEGKFLKLYYTDNDYFVFTSDLNNRKEAGNDYRPFVEDGKVWKVGNTQAILDNSVQVVDYYYFDGDTIIGGKTCKQMMCQRFVSPDYSNEYWTPTPSLTKVGAWYEEDQKVYFYDERKQSMVIKYDFSLAANDTLQFLTDWSSPFIIGPKQTEGIEGFKGVYRDIRMCGDEGQNYHDTFWLEGVGCLRGPLSNPCDPILADPVPEFVMSCVVGDEVIYYNDDREDGATPEVMGARKKRFDFTHTTKNKPKTRVRSGEELPIYGEYNDLRLGINLDPLDDTYLVRITDESEKTVYEKTVNAGSIVALSIDISAYAKGRYTVTVENSDEVFTGQFKTQTAGIEAINNKEVAKSYIYNLQGQRLNSLQKGLNIVNGQKIYVK